MSLLVQEENTGLLVDEPVVKSKTKERQEAADLTEARMLNGNVSSSLRETYAKAKQDVRNIGYTPLMEQERMQYADTQTSEMLNAVEQGMPVEDSMDVLEAAQLNSDIYSDVDGTEQMRNDALPKERSMSELMEARAVARQHAYAEVGEILEGYGVLDYAADIGGLIAPDATKDFYETFGGVDRFEAFAEGFRRMLPEEQMEVFPRVMEHILEGYDDNALDLLWLTEELFDDNSIGGNVAFDAVMDVFGIADVVGLAKMAKLTDGATTAYNAIKASRDLKRSQSKAVQAEELGALETAAVRQAEAGASDEVAEMVGTTKMDVARSLDPNITKNMDDGTSLDGLAGSIGSVIRSKTNTFKPEVLVGEVSKIASAPFRLSTDALGDSVSAISAAGTNTSRAVVQQSELSTTSAIGSGDLGKLENDVEQAVVQQLQVEKAFASASNESKETGAVAKAIDEAVAETDTPILYNEAEVYSAFSRTYETLKKELDESLQGPNSILPKEITKDGVVFEVKTLDGTYDRTMKITKDDVHTIASNLDESVLKRWRSRLAQGVFSPEFLLRPLNEHLVDSTTYAGQQSSKLKNKLAQIWKDTEKGLTKQENFEVNAVLQVGDERAVETFAIAELRAGVETSTGTYKFTDNQIHSYMQKRSYFRKLHSIKDATLRKELEHAGFRSVALPRTLGNGKTTQIHFAKPYTDILDGLKNVEDGVVWKDGKAVRVESVAREASALQENGMQLVQWHTPKMVGDRPIRWGLVDNTAQWRDLPARVLHYQQGYVPRSYRPGYIFVRDMSKEGMGVRAVFETMEDAKRFKDAENANGAKLETFRDGDFSQEDRLVREADAFGGFITGKRKNTLLTVQKNGTEHALERMSVGEATDRYLHNISSVVPLVEYRAAAMARWENDVNAMLKASNRDVGSKINFKTPENEIPLPKDVKGAMMAQRAYIEEQMGMMTKEEGVFEDLALRIANTMEGKDWATPVRNRLLWKSATHPNDVLKAANFNLMLGMFNFRQIFVQMQNASLAMSMYPKYAPAAIPEALAARAFIATKDPKARELLLSKFPKETKEFVQQFDESGMVDSIVRQADLNNQTLGVHHGTLDGVRKFVEAGRIPFNEGEIMARAMAFSIARKKLKAEGVELSTKLINEETLRLNMNMQNENAAWWQNAPIINLATQFLQVQAKFAENLMPTMLGGTGRWTAKEKRNALVGQLALYGVVGVPIAQEAISYLAELSGYANTEEFIDDNPTVVHSVNEGFVGMVAQMLGVEKAEFTSSFSLLAGMDDNIVYDVAKAMMQIVNGGYTDQGFLETAAGPTAQSVRRISNAADTFLGSMATIVTVPSLETVKGALVENLDALASMTSTWSNARKVLLLQEMGSLQTSSGRVIARDYELGELNLQTKLAVAMGFKTDVESLSYMNAEVIQLNKQDLKNVAKDYRSQLIGFSQHGNEDYFKARIAGIFAGISVQERNKIMDRVLKETYVQDSKVARELKTAINMILESGGRLETTASQSTLIKSTR